MKEPIYYRKLDGTEYTLVHDGCGGLIKMWDENNLITGRCGLCKLQTSFVPVPELNPVTGESRFDEYGAIVRKTRGSNMYFMPYNEYMDKYINQ